MNTRYPRRSLAACMLPWTETFELDVPAFEAHVQAALEEGYQSIYLMGTAGEGYALNDRCFQRVVEIFARMAVKDGVDPQVGVISLSMEHVMDRIRFAYDQGIRMFQISLPSWGALDQVESMTFFQTVCGSFPDCRFLHYNLPRAKRIVDGAEYRRIADAVPNLVATKNSTFDYARTADLLQHAPDLQHFLLEGNYAMGCTLGECSLLCSFSVLFPEMSARLYEAGLRGDMKVAFEITEFFRRAVNNLFGHCAGERIDGAYDKTMIWLKNPAFSSRLLPPYKGFTDDELRICRKVFDRDYAEVG